jgi:hypothetical protein
VWRRDRRSGRIVNWMDYFHKVSSSHPEGKPIDLISMFGYSFNKFFNRVLKE